MGLGIGGDIQERRYLDVKGCFGDLPRKITQCSNYLDSSLCFGSESQLKSRKESEIRKEIKVERGARLQTELPEVPSLQWVILVRLTQTKTH